MQPVLQTVDPEAHQKTHGDRAQRHEQAQHDGKAGQPPLDPRLGGTLAHSLAFTVRPAAGSLHGAIGLQNSKQVMRNNRNSLSSWSQQVAVKL